jgi:predicted transcriptional regulator
MEKLSTPQEVEVWYVLPAVRKGLVTEMMKLGLNQKQAAEKLGITEAAVSQYMKGKRGYDVKFDSKTVAEIGKSAKRIVEGANVITELNRICDYSMKHLVLCKIHKMHGAPKKCDICFRKVIEK